MATKLQGRWIENQAINLNRLQLAADPALEADGTGGIRVQLKAGGNIIRDSEGLSVPLTQGMTGIQGYTGLQGDEGPQGDPGATGVQGPTGFQGRTGIQGETGIQGATGVKGPTGIQGETGIQGATGIAGQTGVGELTKQVLYRITPTDSTRGYFTVAPNPINAQSVRVFPVGGFILVNKQVLGASPLAADYDVINTNEIHFQNDGTATGLDSLLTTDDDVVVLYSHL
jgi:hypothetical protein